MLDPSHLYPRASLYAKSQKSALIRDTVAAIISDFVWPFLAAFVFGMIVCLSIALVSGGAR